VSESGTRSSEVAVKPLMEMLERLQHWVVLPAMGLWLLAALSDSVCSFFQRRAPDRDGFL